MEDWCVIDQGDEAGAEALGEADHNLTTLTTSHRLVSSTHRCLASNTVGSQELEKVAGTRSLSIHMLLPLVLLNRGLDSSCVLSVFILDILLQVLVLEECHDIQNVFSSQLFVVVSLYSLFFCIPAPARRMARRNLNCHSFQLPSRPQSSEIVT